MSNAHFADAASALWLDGELVHTEDLVLHDAHMDIRTPTRELTRAHAELRARRRVLLHSPDWPMSRPGLLVLRGREGQGGGNGARAATGSMAAAAGADSDAGENRAEETGQEDALSEELA